MRENAHAGAQVRWSGVVFLATCLSSLAFAFGSPGVSPPTLIGAFGFCRSNDFGFPKFENEGGRLPGRKKEGKKGEMGIVKTTPESETRKLRAMFVGRTEGG